MFTYTLGKTKDAERIEKAAAKSKVAGLFSSFSS